ncbi:MAG: DNA gyrase subunit A, partial [Pseudomonadales bacterium]|nr:DNA gyrase subunit A [Pseudomonadales bacterium]
ATASRPENLGQQYGLHDGKYHLSPEQAQAILELRLHRLTGMEHDKLLEEYRERLEQIGEYLDILSDPLKLLSLIRGELDEVVENFGDERRTEIIESTADLTAEDLIPEEDRVVTISHGGYAKSQPLDDYRAQRRGGMGKSATAVKDEDFVEHLLIANTHDTILLFSNMGKVYWLRVFHIPIAGRNARGRPVVNMLPLEEGERITSILPVSEYLEDHYIFMATANGIVKKTALTDFSRQRSVGLRALELEEGDVLVGTAITDGRSDVLLVSSEGKAVRFTESAVRAMGRTARGVRGIKLGKGHQLISLMIPRENGRVLTVSKNGYGKRTVVDEFPVKGRGTQGVIAMQTSDRNGEIVGAIQVDAGNEMMLISDQGTLVRCRTDEVSELGRNTQGVRVIRLKESEALVSIARIEDTDAADGDEPIEAGEQNEQGEQE